MKVQAMNKFFPIVNRNNSAQWLRGKSFIRGGKSFLYKFFLLALVSNLHTIYSASAQTTTVAAGSWATAANWSAGVPNGGDATVQHSMTLNANLHPSSGTYTINAPVSDLSGGTNYNLSITNAGEMEVNANVTVGGTLSVSQSGSLIVRSGDTLTIGYPGSTATSTFSNTSTILVEAGGVLIINGNLDADNASGTTIHGELIINGNYTSANGATIGGTGTMNTTGTITSKNTSTVFGSTNDCTSGPCSGNNLCTTNTIAAAQSICSGQVPATFTGNNPGSFTYKWQKSTTSSTGGFTDISGAVSQNYSSGALTATSWFRRIVTNGSCTATSVAVKVTVNPYVTPSVTISASPSTTVCAGTSVTFTATPVNGGGTPSYQWKKNGVNVGANSVTYTNATWANNDVITCVLTSNASCVTSTTATSNDITMTVVSGANVWLGSTSSNWATSANWCGGVPAATSNVVIGTAVNMPSITTAGAVCNNLTIQSGATLSVTNGLSVKGNISNSGTITGAGTLTLNGTSAQAISGTGHFTHTTLLNAAGATVTSPVTISGVLSLAAGQLTSNGNLTVNLATGQISSAGTGSIAGNVTFKQTVASANYHYISSPVSTATVNDLNDDVTIQTGQYRNFYHYDETIPNADNMMGWTSITDLNTALSPMKGYALYFNNPATIDFTGPYNHAAVPSNVVLTNTVSPDANADGWNLVGNPYPSTLDWDAASGWTRNNIGSAIYFWDPVNERYATYVTGVGTNGGTRYIPPMQAFWVWVSNTGGTGTFGMNNSVRTTTTTSSLWKMASGSNILKLSVNHGKHADETVIRLREDAVFDFDSQLDAFKLKNEGNVPSFYTVLGKDKYAVNSLPSDSNEYKIPLHLEGSETGAYAIHANELGPFDPSYSILLEDRLEGTKHDLRKAGDYTFHVTSGDTSARFVLHLKKETVTHTSNSESAAVYIHGSGQTVHVEFLKQNLGIASIGVFNSMGEKILVKDQVDADEGKVSFLLSSVKSGIYIVKVQTQAGTVSAKVYLNY